MEEQRQPAMMPLPEPIRPARAVPVWALLAGVAVLGGWVGWVVFFSSARALLQGAGEQELVAKGQYQEAIARLETIVSRTPFQPEAAALLLDARLETGDYRRALEQGEEWLRRGAHAGIAERTAEAAYWLGEYDRASTLIEPFSTLRADWLKGTLEATRGQKAEGRAALER